MAVLKIIAKVLGLSAIVYLGIVILFTFTRQSHVINLNISHIDSYAVRVDQCQDEMRTPIDFAHRLKLSNKPKLIFLGGSGTRDGFRPKEVNALFPAYDAHNLALSAGNVTQAREIVSYLSREHDKALTGAVFVYGASSGSFVSNADRGWDESGTPFGKVLVEHDRNTNERKKFPGSESAIQARTIFAKPMACAALIFKPLTQSKMGIANLIAARLGLIEGGGHNLTVTQKREKIVQRIAKMLEKSFTNPFEEQFNELDILGRLIDDLGGTLYVVQNPTAPWFMEMSDTERAFTAALQSKAERAGYNLVSINEGFSDDMFIDHAHPTQRTTHIWSEMLSNILAINAP